MMPTLYIFRISHYSEKARWALKLLNIEHEVKYLVPLNYRKEANLHGLKRGSVPFLDVAEQPVAIQGSDKILDWAMQQSEAEHAKVWQAEAESSWGIERRLDDVIGVHVRRLIYSDALFSDPKSVRNFFCRGLGLGQRLMMYLAWSKICHLMIKGMDLGAQQRLESRSKLEQELDWLDGLLADDRPFICGDSMSRADITAASLLSPLVLPDNHPEYHALNLPEQTMYDRARWVDRPSFRFVQRMYDNYR